MPRGPANGVQFNQHSIKMGWIDFVCRSPEQPRNAHRCGFYGFKSMRLPAHSVQEYAFSPSGATYSERKKAYLEVDPGFRTIG